MIFSKASDAIFSKASGTIFSKASGMIFSKASTESKPAYQEIEDNEPDLRAPKYRRQPTGIFQYFCIVFLALGWVLTLGFYVHQSNSRPATSNLGLPLQLTPIPHEVFNRVKTVFGPDSRYIGPSTETNHNWDNLVAGHDALYIENPDKYGLPQGIVPPFEHPNKLDPPPNNFYVVSILHQLHCLNMVRSQYWVAKSCAKADEIPFAENWAKHVDHCFEYLRQAISCGGDLTIEGYSPLGTASSVTGWGVSHDCLNFEVLRTYQIQQERLYNLTWQNSA